MEEDFLDAVEEGSLDKVRNFVDQGVDIHFQDDQAIVSAAANGYLDIVRYLLDHGADINARDGIPVNAAAVRGHLDVLKYLVDHGATMTDETIILAGEGGNIDILEYIISKGGNVKARDNSALYNAVSRGNKEMVKFLIANGANVNARNGEILSEAVTTGDLELVDLLVTNGAKVAAGDNEALILAAKTQYPLDIIKYLVEHGANIHAQNDEALVWAATNGAIDNVKYLVEHGADVRAQNSKAAAKAAINGFLETVQYLVDHGAETSEALRNATKYGHTETVDFLESHERSRRTRPVVEERETVVQLPRAKSRSPVKVPESIHVETPVERVIHRKILNPFWAEIDLQVRSQKASQGYTRSPRARPKVRETLYDHTVSELHKIATKFGLRGHSDITDKDVLIEVLLRAKDGPIYRAVKIEDVDGLPTYELHEIANRGPVITNRYYDEVVKRG